MTKYRLGLGIFFLFLMLFPLATTSSANSSAIQLILEGNRLEPDVPPQIIKGRTLVPIRIVAENFGAEVEWDQKAQKVSIVSETTELEMWIGKKDAIVNGKEVAMDVPPRIEQGRTLVPLRFVGESLGTTVGWEASTSSVVINQPYVLNANGKWLENEKVYKFKDELYFPLSALSSYLGAVFQSSEQDKVDRLIYQDLNVNISQDGQALWQLRKMDTGWVVPARVLKKEFHAQIRTEDKQIFLEKVSQLQAIEEKEGKLIIKSTNPMQPQHFLMTGPHRLVIDLPNTILSEELLAMTATQSGVGILHKTRTVSTASKESNPMLDQPIDLPVEMEDEMGDTAPAEREGNEEESFTEPLELTGQIEPNETVNLEPLIKEVRFSQFSLEPQTVRVVVELTQKAKYEMQSVAQGLEFTLQPLPKKEGFLIVLDPGHGGKDPGARGVAGNNEKDLTLSISRQLSEELKQVKGIQVVETRVDDIYPTLQDRVQLANEIEADLFLSIHANSFKPQTRGTETFYYSSGSEAFARVIHQHLQNATEFPDRGVKKSGFYVIKNTIMPSTLIEVGFLTNEEENRKMVDPAFQKRVAKALAEAIKEYYTSYQ